MKGHRGIRSRCCCNRLLAARTSWSGSPKRANQGSLGVFEAKYLIRLMQANAKMLDKFGA